MGKERPEFPDLEDQEDLNRPAFNWPTPAECFALFCIGLGMYACLLFMPVVM